MSHTVLITGAAGFVGTHLLQLLSTTNPTSSIIAWRRPQHINRSTQPRETNKNPNVHWDTVDLLNDTEVSAAVDDCRPTVVYHLAGVAGVHSSWSNNLGTLEGNLLGTKNLIDALERTGRDVRLLISGSALVYKPSSVNISENHPLGPVSPYGLSKLAQEMLGQRAAQGHLEVVLTRSFTHVGPGQEPTYAASSFAYQIARIERGEQKPVIKVGSLSAKRDLMDVRDTVRAYVTLMDKGLSGLIYNVCTGGPSTMEDVLDSLIMQARAPVSLKTDKDRLRPNDNLFLVGDPSLIHAHTGWKAKIPLNRTLLDLLNYWRGVLGNGWRHRSEES